jgi:hypothetical protein
MYKTNCFLSFSVQSLNAMVAPTFIIFIAIVQNILYVYKTPEIKDVEFQLITPYFQSNGTWFKAFYNKVNNNTEVFQSILHKSPYYKYKLKLRFQNNTYLESNWSTLFNYDVITVIPIEIKCINETVNTTTTLEDDGDLVLPLITLSLWAFVLLIIVGIGLAILVIRDFIVFLMRK